jgi:hypothetical protein
MVIENRSCLSNCVVDIPDQIGINGVSFSTGGTSPSRDINITFNATNMKATVITSTGACPLTVGSHTTEPTPGR